MRAKEPTHFCARDLAASTDQGVRGGNQACAKGVVEWRGTTKMVGPEETTALASEARRAGENLHSREHLVYLLARQGSPRPHPTT